MATDLRTRLVLDALDMVVTRPTMRLVPLNSSEPQAALILH